MENLREVSAAAIGTRKDLWVILQLSTHVEGNINNRRMSVETVRWQAMTALAFGARAIGWFSWLWYNSWVLNAYDAKWQKTPAYDGEVTELPAHPALRALLGPQGALDVARRVDVSVIFTARHTAGNKLAVVLEVDGK